MSDFTEKASRVFALVEHNINELVNDPTVLQINKTENGEDLLISIVAPERECARLIGRRGRGYKAVCLIASAVAKKYALFITIKVRRNDKD